MWSAPADSKLCFRLTENERFNDYRRQTVYPKVCSRVAYLYQVSKKDQTG